MAPHRVLTIARQELRTHARSPLAWGLLAFTIFATLFVNPAAMIPSGDAAIGGVQPFSNSRHAMAQSFALTGLIFYTFLTSVLAGLSLLRDDEARVGDLLHSTPLTAAEYVVGKFSGVIGALFTVLSLHLAIAIAWREAARPWVRTRSSGRSGFRTTSPPRWCSWPPGSCSARRCPSPRVSVCARHSGSTFCPPRSSSWPWAGSCRDPRPVSTRS